MLKIPIPQAVVRRCSVISLFVAIVCLDPHPAAAGSDFGLYGDLTVSTDYVFRGVSQTMSSAAIQATLGADHSSGLFAYIWVSNIDYTDVGDPDDGADIEIDALLGYSLSLSEHSEVSLSWVQYLMPGTRESIDYDYSEWIASAVIAQRHRFTASYAPHVFGSGSSGAHYSAASGLEVFGDNWLELELGHYDLDDAYGASYSYAELSLAGSANILDWRLSYVATGNSAEDVFNESIVQPRAIFAVGLSF